MILLRICFIGLLAVSCIDSSKLEEPTSTLEPDNFEEITDLNKLAKRMFTSVLTRLPDGMIGSIIHKDEDKFWLEINYSDETLHKICLTEDTCVGGVYSGVHNKEKGGEILHRIYTGKTLEASCAWIEFYPEKFALMDKALQENIAGRSWHWVKECFKL